MEEPRVRHLEPNGIRDALGVRGGIGDKVNIGKSGYVRKQGRRFILSSGSGKQLLHYRSTQLYCYAELACYLSQDR
jgi:hypothetical protein